MSYKNIREFLNCDNPESYNFEFQFDNEEYRSLSTFERYFTYKAVHTDKGVYSAANMFIDKCKANYLEIVDPDGSGSKFDNLICEIYNDLWGWIREKDRFGKSDLFLPVYDNLFKVFRWGADTINSVQTIMNLLVDSALKTEKYEHLVAKKAITNKKLGQTSIKYMLEIFDSKTLSEDLVAILHGTRYLENFINVYHTIGNFVLVPAGFNGWRGSKGTIKQGEGARKINDNWGLSLRVLRDPNVRSDSFDEAWIMNPQEFNSYINTFFLWDYVDCKGNPRIIDESNSDKFLEFACAAILRRGHFMVLMLWLREKLEETYFAVMRGVFLEKETTYVSYDEVFKNLRSQICLNEKKIIVCEDTSETVENLLDKTQKQINNIRLPEVSNES